MDIECFETTGNACTVRNAEGTKKFARETYGRGSAEYAAAHNAYKSALADMRAAANEDMRALGLPACY